MSSPAYHGPILIRGAQVDGYGSVGFNVNGAGPPLAELQFPEWTSSSPRLSSWPSYTRVRAPGCYAYQVDGTDFSYVVVFSATPLR